MRLIQCLRRHSSIRLFSDAIRVRTVRSGFRSNAAPRPSGLCRILCISVLSLLFSCASTLPTEVRIPVPVPCIEELPAKPPLITDADLAALPDAAFILALAADRLERAKYEAVMEATLLACVK